MSGKTYQVEVWREATVPVNDTQVSELLVKAFLGDESGNVLQGVEVFLVVVELGRLVTPQPLAILFVRPSLKLVNVVLVGHNI